MTNSTSFSQRIAALASAITLSLVLFAGTVSVPSPAQAASHSAYVGVVA